ncbi:MAG: hypothetical protein FP812_12820, partial [Desulfobacula sp.]|nr:hypothetical protein [Desulfobacula sp.]
MRIKIHRESLFNFETSIGNLTVFEINYSDESRLSQSLACRFNEAKPIDAIKHLFRLISFFPKDLLEGKYEPKKPILQKEDVDKLPPEEIENFAKKLIEKDKSLSTMIFQSTVEEDYTQEAPHHDKNNEQIKDGETYIEFSHRLISKYFKINNDRIEALEKKLLKNSGYPSDLLKEMEKQFSVSKSFIEDAQKYATIPEWANYISPIPESVLSSYSTIPDSVYSSPVPESFFPEIPSPETPDMHTYMPDTLEDVLEKSSKPLYQNLKHLNS